MKKAVLIVLLVFGFVIIGCDMGNSGNPGNPGNNNNGNNENENNNNGNNENGNETISLGNLSIKNSSIKSLYISNIPVNENAGNARAVSSSTITTLSYINNLGQNAPFFFVSPSGKNIVLGVSEVKQLDEKRIVVDFSSSYEITQEGNVFTIGETITESGRALIDMKSGKVYDFKDYKNIRFVSNDLLFNFDNSTLYKVDLNTMSAVPLNNPTYNPITFPNRNILFGNKIIVDGNASSSSNGNIPLLVIDINNEFLPKSLVYPTSTDIPFGTSGRFFYYGIHMVDLSGNPYRYDVSGTDYFTCKVSIDNDGKVLLSDIVEGTHTFSVNDISYIKYENFIFPMYSSGVSKWTVSYDYYRVQSILLYTTNGFIRLKKKSDGIQVESTALSIPLFDNYDNSDTLFNRFRSCFINTDNYLYYFEGSSIKRLYLASGETPEVVYSNNRLLTSGPSGIDYLTASGSNLIFYQYAYDNITVNTYLLAMYRPGATPELLASSSMDVKNIIELDF